MIQPVTYETTRLLAQGYPPSLLAKLDGVTVRAIHLRRQRFEKATGGGSIGRFGKLGRPRKGESAGEVIARGKQRRADAMRDSRRKWEAQEHDTDE